jgi:hypothetical protein
MSNLSKFILLFVYSFIIQGCATQKIFSKNEVLLEQTTHINTVSEIEISKVFGKTTYSFPIVGKTNFPEIRLNNSDPHCLIFESGDEYSLTYSGNNSSNIFSIYPDLSSDVKGGKIYDISVEFEKQTEANNAVSHYLLLGVKPINEQFLEEKLSPFHHYRISEGQNGYYFIPFEPIMDFKNIHLSAHCPQHNIAHTIRNNERNIVMNYTTKKRNEEYAHPLVRRIILAPFALAADIIIMPPYILYLMSRGM